jgi:glycosyltransferase involved in cell wall biosynthesis
LKIVQICYSGLGGHSGVAFPLVSADLDNKHDWSIGFVGNTSMIPDFKYKCQDLNIQYEQFKFRFGLPFIQWFQLFRWLRAINPESIICHNPSFIIPCKFYSIFYSARLLVVEHTNNKLKRNREWVFSYLSMLLAHVVVTLTPDYRNELKEKFSLSFQQKKFFIIPNGIDTNIFSFIKKDCAKRSRDQIFRIGMAARFSDSKKQDLLIEMMKHLNASKPEFSIHLSLAGNGPELIRVKNLVKSYDLGSIITFDGLLNESDLAKWYTTLDLYAHASSGETLSISILQAMSCGVPIIASDVDGISNLLNQDETYGLCIDNTDIFFADAASYISENASEARLMSDRASAVVKKYYSNRAMLENYLLLM